MGAVSSYEAKTNLSKLLKRAAEGEPITITKHGVSVARLVPVGPSKKPDVGALIQEIRNFRKGRTLSGMSLKELIEEGRRF
jgi:prevent-host-death family protein